MNRPIRIRRALLTCTLCALAFNQAVLAQPEEEIHWYQVETIVFAQGGSARQGEEIWRSDVTLDYPLNWLELVSPAQLSPASTAGEHGMENSGEDGMENSSSTASDDNSSDNRETGIPSEIIDPSRNVGNRALLLLPREELTLSNEAERLSRNNRYRILFHGAWRQPMVENREEPSVLISGGERFDQHSELEGSINLYRRTYLHLETNLWFTQFAANFGQQHRPWPRLPWPPNRPPRPDHFILIDDGGTGLWHQFNQGQESEYAAILAQPYIVENIVHMQQRRRLRSGELHYIDHPQMGVLVKLTPYLPTPAPGLGY